ncbi:MAG: hypothetical protein U0K95_00205 [Eubacterium sp.]|nr:hypothetical protein [Eubacterium sp.]
MKKKTLFSLTVGLPTILLVFIVLCLLSFAVLSYVSAQADWKLCSKALEHSDAYYQAVNKAEETLEAISNGEKAQPYYYFPISDLQSLYISLSLAENGTYEIIDWKVISNDNITYDEHLHVIP